MIISLFKFKLNKKGIQLYPNFNFDCIKVNSIIKVGFEGLELKVLSKSNSLINTKVIKEE